MLDAGAEAVAPDGPACAHHRWALDLAPLGVRANALVPGPTDTSLVRHIVGTAVPLLEECTMSKRLGWPEEIAAAASFLLSNRARCMTGSVLAANGGFCSFGTDFRPGVR